MKQMEVQCSCRIKISIAIKWAKAGEYSHTKELVEHIDTDMKLREANLLKVNVS